MEWISVKDRLPCKSDNVLLWGKDQWEINRYYNRDEFEREYKDVTHWTPLPEPPETT
jgi:hypothetical protein